MWKIGEICGDQGFWLTMAKEEDEVIFVILQH